MNVYEVEFVSVLILSPQWQRMLNYLLVRVCADVYRVFFGHATVHCLLLYALDLDLFFWHTAVSGSLLFPPTFGAVMKVM